MVVSILLPMNGKSHLQSDAGRQHLPDRSARHDGDPKPSYECSKPTRPEREQSATIKNNVAEHTVKT